jgi:hypothetical protein
MNIRFPQNAGNFLASWRPVGFSRRTVLHGVSYMFMNGRMQGKPNNFYFCHQISLGRSHLRVRCCRANAISVTYTECVSVALVIQHETRMRCIILSSVACLAVPYFSTFSYKRHDFRGESYWTQNCVFWFSLQLLSQIFLILRRIEPHIIINVHRSSCKVPVILVRF